MAMIMNAHADKPKHVQGDMEREKGERSVGKLLHGKSHQKFDTGEEEIPSVRKRPYEGIKGLHVWKDRDLFIQKERGMGLRKLSAYADRCKGFNE